MNVAEIDRLVAERIVDTMLDAGFSVSVWDCEDQPEMYVHPSTDKKQIMDEMFTVQDEILFFYKPNRLAYPYGSVRLIYGQSGWDVVNDYSMNIESLIEPILDWAEERWG